MNGWDDGELPDEEIKALIKPNLVDFKKSTGLVLPSGGVKGLYIIGAVQYLYEKIGLDHIQSYYGTSIGSIIAGLLIIGYSPIEILVWICVQKIMSHLISSFNISKLLTDKRMIDSSVFVHLLSDMITKKVGFIPTMGELYSKFKKRLCVVTISRENAHVPLYISSDSHPSLSMVHALHMSSSIPYVFGYASYDNIEYFDGAFLDPFPLLYASKQEEWAFGIEISNVWEKSDDIFTDVKNMIMIPMTFISNMLKKDVIYGSYITLDTKDELVTNRASDLITMFSSGYRQCKKYLCTETETEIDMDTKCKKEKND